MVGFGDDPIFTGRQAVFIHVNQRSDPFGGGLIQNPGVFQETIHVVEHGIGPIRVPFQTGQVGDALQSFEVDLHVLSVV